MRKVILQPLLLGLALFGGLSLTSQTDSLVNRLTASGSLNLSSVDTIFRTVRQFPIGTQFSIALLDTDSVSYFGTKNTQRAVESVDNRREKFAIGSITKVFTTTLLAKAVTAGRVNLDDPINDLFDFPFADTTDLTFRQLANHTSGLPRMPNNMPGLILNPTNPFASYTPEKVEAYLQENLERNEIGKYVYSNLGVGLLGYVLSNYLYNSDYVTETRRQVLKPYGLSNTSVASDSAFFPTVVPLALDGSSTPHWQFTDAMAGAGSAVSTAEDMVGWARVQLARPDSTIRLSQETTHRDSERRAIALGWHQITDNVGQHYLLHDGGVGGFRAILLINLEKDRAVVVLSNVSAYHAENNAIDRLAFKLIRGLDD